MFHVKAKSLANQILHNWVTTGQLQHQMANTIAAQFNEPNTGAKFEQSIRNKYPNGVDDQILMQLTQAALVQIQQAIMAQAQYGMPHQGVPNYGMPAYGTPMYGNVGMYGAPVYTPPVAPPATGAAGTNITTAVGGTYTDEAEPVKKETKPHKVEEKRSDLTMTVLEAAYCTTTQQKLAVRLSGDVQKYKSVLLDIERACIEMKLGEVAEVLKWDTLNFYEDIYLDSELDLGNIIDAVLPKVDITTPYFRNVTVAKLDRVEVPHAQLSTQLNALKEKMLAEELPPIENFGFIDQLKILERALGELSDHAAARAIEQELLRKLNNCLYRELRISTKPKVFLQLNKLSELEVLLSLSGDFYQALRDCSLFEAVLANMVNRLIAGVCDNSSVHLVTDDSVYVTSKLTWRIVSVDDKLVSSNQFVTFNENQKKNALAVLKEVSLMSELRRILVTNYAPPEIMFTRDGHFIPRYNDLGNPFLHKNAVQDMTGYTPFDALLASLYLDSSQLPERLVCIGKSINGVGRQTVLTVCPMLDGGGVFLI
jgi:hypothetical protein